MSTVDKKYSNKKGKNNMSMANNPYVCHAAFLIYGDAASAINLKVDGDIRNFSELSESELDNLSDSDRAAFILDDANISLTCLPDFEGEAENLRTRLNMNFAGENLFLIECEKPVSLFDKAYNNFDEIVEEFREKLKDFLPDDFPVEDYIYSVNGVYYC